MGWSQFCVAAFGLAAAVLVFAGCSSDPDPIDGGPDASVARDTGPGRADAAPGADRVAPVDAGIVDTGVVDAGARDAGAGTDAAPTDAAPTDAVSADALPADAATADAATADAAPADAATVDGATLDSGTSDAGFGDAVVVDMGVPDSGAPDLGFANIGGTVQLASAHTATVTIIEPVSAARAVRAAPDGNFQIQAPVGVPVMVQVDADEHVSRIQGYVLGPNGDTRDFYMTPTAALDEIRTALGVSITSTAGIVWIDFRNSSVGGFTATVSAAHGPSLTLLYNPNPNGAPVLSNATLEGVPASELIFLEVAPPRTTVLASPPAGRMCTPRDPLIADWPVIAGVMTQVDFECN